MIKVVVMGRLSADIYPTEIRKSLKDQKTFTRYVGGFAGNVSTGLARLDVKTAIVSKVGNDGHGEYVKDFLANEGVDVQWLGIDKTLNTPVVFCEIWPPDRFPLLFYRLPTCPDWELTREDFDVDAVADAPFLLVSGTGLARENSRKAHDVVIAQHRHAAIFDLDYRQLFWPSSDAYSKAVQAVLPRADIVVGNDEEVATATGVKEARQAIKAIQAAGPRIVILKRGGEGAVLFDGDRVLELPPVKLGVVNGLGAGDAFLAAFTQGLLRGMSLELAIRRANWSGAYVASQIACSAAMPYLEDLDAAVAAEIKA